MKRAKFLNLLIASVVLLSLGSGCKKNPKNITPIERSRQQVGDGGILGRPTGPNSGNPVGLNDPSGRPIGGVDPSTIAEPVDGTQDRGVLAQYVVYFDFDRSAVKPSEASKVEAVATYLKSNPDARQLLVEGHCDERGTEEYNRALGERRAIAIRELLIQRHGIASDRVTTVSFGEDKPKMLEKTEEAYAQNRRGEFVILR